MNETIACPGCQAELVLPILPAGQTVQCPRCQNVFEPALRRARPAASSSAPVARRRANDEYPNEPIDEPVSPPRYQLLVGEWKATAAMIFLALSVLSYGLHLYINFEKNQIIKLEDQAFGRFALLPEQVVQKGMNLAELQRRQINVEGLARFAYVGHVFTYWPAVVLVLIWLHQASRNLRILQATGLVYSPAQAVWSFFIPFVNLAQPYMVMQEIWRASDPLATKDTRSWQHVPGAKRVLLWWLTLVVAAFLSLWAQWMFHPRAIELGMESESTWLGGASNLCMIVAGLSLIAVIRDIRVRQHARHARIYDEAA